MRGTHRRSMATEDFKIAMRRAARQEQFLEVH